MTATLRPPGVDASSAEAMVMDPTDRAAARRRLLVHLVALGVVLWTGALAIGIDHVVSADEGAVLGQARVAQRNGGFGLDYWAASFDPDGRWFPFDLSEQHDGRWYLFTKKPLYVELVAAADGLAGPAGVLLLHVGGVVAAAGVAALVARRLRPGLDGWTVWAVGLGSPLVIDARWVIAHAPAAAAVAVGGLATLEARSGRRFAPLSLVAAIVVATLLRNEATLWGLALAAVAVGAWVRDRSRTDARLAVAAVAGTGLGVVVATAWQRAVEGGSDTGPYVIRDQVGWLAARSQAAWNLVVAPQAEGTSPVAFVAVLAATVLVALAWWPAVRRRPALALGLAGSAVALLAVRLVVGGSLVPGLLPAWPVGVAALAAVGRPAARGRRPVRPDDRNVLLAVGLLFAGAVLATTYAAGGTGDWGARYLHLGLPLVVPVALAALADVVTVDPHRTRRLLLPLGASAVLLAAIAGRTAHDAVVVSRTVDLAAARAAAADPEAGGRGPAVVVSTSPAFGRQAWRHAVDGRYLTLDPRRGDLTEQAAELDRLLDRAGVGAVVVVGSRADVRRALLGFQLLCTRPKDDVDPIGETWMAVSLRECPGTV